MVRLKKFVDIFSPQSILVAGDFMVDEYTYGHVSRISPEAPVPVHHVKKKERKAGGAGNVVLNLLALGAKPFALGQAGEDDAGSFLLRSLRQKGANVEHFVCSKNIATIQKNRLIAGQQQLLRIDTEEIASLSRKEEKKLIALLPSLVQKVKIVTISDYKKGFLSRHIITALIKEAKKQNRWVVVDPKGTDFTKYAGADIIKPNLQEAYAAAHLPLTEPLEDVAEKIFLKTSCEYLLITRSEKGISLFSKDRKRKDFAVDAKEVLDVTGAGDTVLATLSLALANDCCIDEAIILANMAAQIAIKHVGCYSVTLSCLLECLFHEKNEYKIFSAHHLFAVQEILRSYPFSLLVLSSFASLPCNFFDIIKSLALREKLILYIAEKNKDKGWERFFSSLREITLVVQEKKDLQILLKELSPSKTYIVQNGILQEDTSPHNLLQKVLQKKAISC